MNAARFMLKVALVGASAAAYLPAVAQDGGGAAAEPPASTRQAPGTLEILLGRQSRQQARTAAAANSVVGSVAASLRTEQQPIATGASVSATRGEPTSVARTLSVAAPSSGAADSEGGAAPTRANALGRDTPATSLGPSDSSASDAMVAPPAPQK